jgi:hypothetical protein
MLHDCRALVNDEEKKKTAGLITHLKARKSDQEKRAA